MLRQLLLLAGNGVPWDELMRWSPVRRHAAVVAIGEMKGRTFDWNRGVWAE